MYSRFRRSPKNLTIRKVYETFYGSTIPEDLHGVFNTGDTSPYVNLWPWNDGQTTTVAMSLNFALDDTYLNVRSADKFVTHIIYDFLKRFPNATEGSEYAFTDTAKKAMAVYLKTRFNEKWTHIWNIYMTEYSPLNNHSSSETRTRANTESKTGSRTNTKNLTDTKVHPIRTVQNNSLSTPATTETTQVQGTEQVTHGHVITHPTSTNETTSNNVFGFNTSDEEGVPQSTSTTVQTNTSTETNSGVDTTGNTGTTTKSMSGTDTLAESSTETYTGTDSEMHTGTDSDSTSESVAGNETITVSRTGTLYRAPAELLSLDRDLWLWDFFEMVFEDVDSVLTLPFYSESPINNFYWGQDLS